MCAWGDWQDVEVTVPAHLSCTGVPRKKFAKIDRCIAPLVRELESQGIAMAGSCCGHGKTEATIVLADGFVLPLLALCLCDRDTA